MTWGLNDRQSSTKTIPASLSTASSLQTSVAGTDSPHVSLGESLIPRIHTGPSLPPLSDPLCLVNRTPVHRTVLTRPPAKLNLFLELLGKRGDGYHEIETVMVAIDWRDELTVSVTDEPGIRLRVDWIPSEEILARRLGVAKDRGRRESLLGIPQDGSNLVHRALTRFTSRFAIMGGFQVALRKRIPAGAGMGGASSDAAAALRAAATLFGIPTYDPPLQKIAAEIGSDVPFFLGLGGEPVVAARACGRGELIEPLRVSASLDFVVVFPNESLSTATVYAQSQVPEHPRTADDLIAALASGSVAAAAAAAHNRLSLPAQKMSPRVNQILTELSQSGLMGGVMTGSGSACFAFAESAEQARWAEGILRTKLEPGAIVVATRSVVVPAAIEIG